MIDCYKVDKRLENGVEVYSPGFFDATEKEMGKILEVIYGKEEV